MAEKLFLNSEENFEDFCDNANDLMQSVTPEARFRWVNRAWLETLGYNEKQIANMTVFDIIHPDELEHCQQLFKEVMSGEDVGRITTAFVTKDGSKIIVEGEVNCEFNQGNPIYTRGIFRNITGRKQAEELFRSLAMSSPVGVYIVQDREFQYINAAFQRFTGYIEDELLGTDSLGLVVPEDREMVRENAVKMLKGQHSQPYEYRSINKVGELKWVLETVAPIEYSGKRATIGTYVDITEHKQAEQALEESENKYRNLTASLSEVIYRCNPETFFVTYVNKSIENLYGYTVEEWLKDPTLWEKAIHPEDKEKVLAGLARASVKKQPYIHEYQIIRKDKSVRWVRDHVSWEKDKQGDPVSVNGVMYDITKLKQAEEKREQLLQELQETLKEVRTLSGLLPICAWCKKLRDDEGYWKSVEEYIGERTKAEFTHGMCPECFNKFLTKEDSKKET